MFPSERWTFTSARCAVSQGIDSNCHETCLIALARARTPEQGASSRSQVDRSSRARAGTAARITYDHVRDNDPAFAHFELAWLANVGGGTLAVGTWNFALLPIETARTTISVSRGTHQRLPLEEER